MQTLDWQILNQKVKPKYNECMKCEQFSFDHMIYILFWLKMQGLFKDFQGLT